MLAQTDDTGATAATYAYSIFGSVTGTGPAAATNPYTYASGQSQPTGLIKFGTRYYNPNLGRWTQRDSVPSSLTNPGATNRYTYVGNNPLNGTDPSGRNTVGFSIEACAILCLSFDFAVDNDLDVGIGTTFSGFGLSLSGSITASADDLEEGAYGDLNYSRTVGGSGVSASDSGDVTYQYGGGVGAECGGSWSTGYVY